MPEPNISSFTGLLSDKDRDVADVVSNVDAVSLAKNLVQSLRRARWNKMDWGLSGSTENPHDNYLVRSGLMDLSSGITRSSSANANAYNEIMEKLNNIRARTAPQKKFEELYRQAPFEKKYDSGTLMLNYPTYSQLGGYPRRFRPLDVPYMPRLDPDKFIPDDLILKRTLGI